MRQGVYSFKYVKLVSNYILKKHQKKSVSARKHEISKKNSHFYITHFIFQSFDKHAVAIYVQ